MFKNWFRPGKGETKNQWDEYIFSPWYLIIKLYTIKEFFIHQIILVSVLSWHFVVLSNHSFYFCFLRLRKHYLFRATQYTLALISSAVSLINLAILKQTISEGLLRDADSFSNPFPAAPPLCILNTYWRTNSLSCFVILTTVSEFPSVEIFKDLYKNFDISVWKRSPTSQSWFLKINYTSKTLGLDFAAQDGMLYPEYLDIYSHANYWYIQSDLKLYFLLQKITSELISLYLPYVYAIIVI